MAAATSPTLTSTSHTLTGQSIMAPASAANSNPAVDMAAFLASLQPENRHAFLEPTASLPSDSLSIVKDTLEAFAAQVCDAQQERLRESRKRKRGGEKVADDVLKLRKVYIDGFETGQVWQQAKKIVGSVLKFSEGVVDDLEENGAVVALATDSEDEEGGVKSLTFGEDGFEVGSDEDDDDDDEEGEDGANGVDEEEDDEEDEEDEDADTDADAATDDGPEDDEDNEEQEDKSDDEEDDEDEAEEYVEDPNGLNDGFFSIDDFNKQTQWFENQDAKGDPNTDHASDDEDIDWAADPMAPSKPGAKSSKKNSESLDDEESDDDNGPTFGDMALDAPEGASDDEAMADEDDDDEANDLNANEVYYKDFFAPPPRKNKSGKPPKKKEARLKHQQPKEEDVERAMADVKRDLFDDESENEDSDDALSDVSAGDPKSRRSTHERRQAKLAEEIRKLEAASVAKREWTLSGEAAAADRPMNSLLEEDVDFEHVGKPVPVITPEISESIEALIKRRILSQEFDEVLRRRPDTDSVPAHTRRGLVELDDSKPDKSLAEVYEEEHIKNTNPDSYVSKSDEKLQREEKEIEAMWKDVSGRLDALSSWYYKPKPAAPQLSVVSDVATVAMEDAQPTTAQGVAGESSRMAPQEIYKAGADKDSLAKGEVVTKAGLPVARQEMSREDRTRRRRRHKERVRKAGGTDAQNDKKLGTRAKMQRDTMAELKKGGVKVINRKGEITDVDGNKAKPKKAVTSSSFKL